MLWSNNHSGNARKSKCDVQLSTAIYKNIMKDSRILSILNNLAVFESGLGYLILSVWNKMFSIEFFSVDISCPQNNAGRDKEFVINQGCQSLQWYAICNTPLWNDGWDRCNFQSSIMIFNNSLLLSCSNDGFAVYCQTNYKTESLSERRLKRCFFSPQ